MDFKKASTIALLMLVLVLFSGCLGGAKTCPVQVSQTDGLAIKRIEPSYYMIPVGDTINVYMDVQNRGNAKATGVSATLWAHAGFVISGKDKITAVILESPRLDICSEGDVYTFAWRMAAGCDPVETILAVHLDYDYSSSGFAKIPLASREEYERTQGKLKAKSENFPSAGPLKVTIQSIQSEPVLIGEGVDAFSVRVIFENSGKGLVGPKGVGEINEVKLTLSGPCNFTNRNERTARDEELGATVDPTNKILTWIKNSVVLKSGKQEAFKIAYLVYDGDPGDFIEDVCRIEVDADYHYVNVESPSQRMGVYGSPSQITACLEIQADTI